MAHCCFFFFVVNRAQRCELHKLAVFLVGGEGSAVLCAELMLVAILVKYESARNFERVILLFCGWRNGPPPVKWVAVAKPTTPARKPKRWPVGLQSWQPFAGIGQTVRNVHTSCGIHVTFACGDL